MAEAAAVTWADRVKSDLCVTLANGQTRLVEQLTPSPKQAYLYRHVQAFTDID